MTNSATPAEPPNATTNEAMAELEAGQGKKFASVDDLIADLHETGTPAGFPYPLTRRDEIPTVHHWPARERPIPDPRLSRRLLRRLFGDGTGHYLSEWRPPRRSLAQRLRNLLAWLLR